MITDRIKIFQRSAGIPKRGGHSNAIVTTAPFYLDKDQISKSPLPETLLNEDFNSNKIVFKPQTKIRIDFHSATISRIILIGKDFNQFEIRGNNRTAIFKNFRQTDNAYSYDFLKGEKKFYYSPASYWKYSAGIAPFNGVTILSDKSSVGYFYFDPIRLSNIEIIPNFQRNTKDFELTKVILTNEIGTFEGFPNIGGMAFSNNAITYKSKAGGRLTTKQNRTLDKISLNCRNYNKPNDIRLLHTLHNSQDSFYLWPCGGNEKQFRFLQEGYRLQDFYHVQTSGGLSVRYNAGNYRSVMDAKLSFSQVI